MRKTRLDLVEFTQFQGLAVNKPQQSHCTTHHIIFCGYVLIFWKSNMKCKAKKIATLVTSVQKKVR